MTNATDPASKLRAEMKAAAAAKAAPAPAAKVKKPRAPRTSRSGEPSDSELHRAGYIRTKYGGYREDFGTDR